MTISSQTRTAGPFTGNGITTAFPFAFKVFTASDLLVVRADLDDVESTLVLGTDYTVTLNVDQNSNPGGTVTLTSALASGFLLTLTSQVPLTQSTDLTNQGGFYPNVINTSLDKLTILTQQLNEQVSRAAKVPITSSTDPDVLVANVNLLADNLPAVQAVNANQANINTVAGSIANVNAVGPSIANVNAVGPSIANVNAVGPSISSVNTVSTNISSVNSAATNMAAIIAAPTNAASAANSAALAAASAASGMYSAVQDKSVNYTAVAADAGDLLRVSTGAGAVTITLPLIAGAGIGDGFKLAVVKWSADTNVVNVVPSGSDTINGATGVTINSQYSQTTLVADGETGQWFAVVSGLGTTSVVVDRFSGTGSTTAFALSGNPGALNNTYVFVAGVYRQKNTYSLSGNTLTFIAAPAAGTNNIEVVWTEPLAIGTPSDGTVTTAKLVDGAVTTFKIGDGAVTPAKFSADAQYSMQGFRNRFINGGMRIDQRNAGASVVNAFVTDRFYCSKAAAATATYARTTAAPSGFVNSLSLSVTTGGSIATGDTASIQHGVEGFNIADFGWGASAAQTVTLSFWVRSSVTGTYGVSFRNASTARSFIASYTVAAANTWEFKSLVIPGDTAGTWATDNSAGIYINWDTGVGTTSSGSATGAWQAGNLLGLTGGVKVNATTGATFYITGVQLEAGSVATPFERRDYGRELIMCQRYFETSPFNPRLYGSTSDILISPVFFQTAKRAAPSVSYSSITYLNASNLVVQNITTQTFGARWSVTASGQSEVLATYSASAEL